MVRIEYDGTANLNPKDIHEKKLGKVEKILKGSLDSIPSPPPSVEIQIMGGKVCYISIRIYLITFAKITIAFDKACHFFRDGGRSRNLCGYNGNGVSFTISVLHKNFGHVPQFAKFQWPFLRTFSFTV